MWDFRQFTYAFASEGIDTMPGVATLCQKPRVAIVITKFMIAKNTLYWNKALWLVKRSRKEWNIQSKCFISVWHSCAMLKFVVPLGSWFKIFLKLSKTLVTAKRCSRVGSRPFRNLPRSLINLKFKNLQLDNLPCVRTLVNSPLMGVAKLLTQLNQVVITDDCDWFKIKEEAAIRKTMKHVQFERIWT